MGQRLGIATALLGDPSTLSARRARNGLDPEGIHWMRNLLKGLAAEGRTVFVSSHLMSEMALTAEHLIVIGRGRLIADTSVEEFVPRASRTARPRPLAAGDAAPRTDRGARRRRSTRVEPGVLEVSGLTAARIGEIAAAHSIVLHELTQHQASLEEAFMALTSDDVEFRAPGLDAEEAAA